MRTKVLCCNEVDVERGNAKRTEQRQSKSTKVFLILFVNAIHSMLCISNVKHSMLLCLCVFVKTVQVRCFCVDT